MQAVIVAINQKQESVIKNHITSSVYLNGNESKMSESADLNAHAMFTVDSRSHPAADRYLVLDDPMRIGRAICPTMPSNQNLVFNCKVMSRNHALLWYDKGSFFLKDLESSNGTFVNNVKLVSLVPHVIQSGDIIQFGINVTDNSNMHDCIVGTFKLFSPEHQIDFTNVGMKNAQISMDQLHSLNLCVQEALQREYELENKMAKVHEFLEKAEAMTDMYWNNFIKEDKLYSTIESLELRLAFYLRNCPNDQLKGEIDMLRKEKDLLISKSKETLMSLNLQRLGWQDKCSKLQIEVSKNESRINSLTSLENEREKQYLELVKTYDASQKMIVNLRSSLSESKSEFNKLKEEYDNLKASYDADFDNVKDNFNSLITQKDQIQKEVGKLQEQIVQEKLSDKVVIDQNDLNQSVRNLRNAIAKYENEVICNLQYLDAIFEKINKVNNCNKFTEDVRNPDKLYDAVMNDYANSNSPYKSLRKKEFENLRQSHEKILLDISELAKKTDLIQEILHPLTESRLRLEGAVKLETEVNQKLRFEIKSLSDKLHEVEQLNVSLVKELHDLNVGFETISDSEPEAPDLIEFSTESNNNNNNNDINININNDLSAKITSLEDEITLVKEKYLNSQSRNVELENALEELQKKCNSSNFQFSSRYYFFYVLCLFVISYLLNTFYFHFQ